MLLKVLNTTGPMEHPAVTATRRKVEDCKGHWPRVIELTRDESGDAVSRSWLSQFARGEITNPTIGTLQAVSDACDQVLAELPAHPKAPTEAQT